MKKVISVTRVNRLVIVGLLLIFFTTSISAKTLQVDVDIKKYVGKIYLKIKKPKGEGPFPAVVLMHGCDGYTGAPKKSLNLWAKIFRKNGYATVIVDSFSGRKKAGGIVCKTLAELGAARYYRTWDAYAVHEYLDSLAYINDKIFLVGQSNGGGVALTVSRASSQTIANTDRKFTAVAALYSWCKLILSEDAKFISPVIVLSGELDEWTPASECRQAEKMHADKDLKVVIYPDAHHSFDIQIPIQKYVNKTVGFNAHAFKDSQEQILLFFKKYQQ